MKNQREATASLFSLLARSMGFEPTIFPVTGGRVNRATPRPHMYYLLIVAIFCLSHMFPSAVFLKCHSRLAASDLVGYSSA